MVVNVVQLEVPGITGKAGLPIIMQKAKKKKKTHPAGYCSLFESPLPDTSMTVILPEVYIHIYTFGRFTVSSHLGGNQSPWTNPTQTQGEDVNTTQKEPGIDRSSSL